jgi:hypothetical protein
MHYLVKLPDEALAEAVAKNTDEDEDFELFFDLFDKYIS